jgi:hypothetical protein
MLTRDITYGIQALEERIVVTCSTANQVHTATANGVQSTTAASGVNGRIIDRLGDMLTQVHRVAFPMAYLWATRGSTEADRKLTLGLKLQHGDSSGGGDMADYSTGAQPTDRTFFTTARSTESVDPDGTTVYSSGPFYAQTNQAYYDLRAAKQFIRVVVNTSKNKVTTESSGDEGYHVGAVIALGGAEALPVAAWKGAGSTTTSTSA